LGDLIAGLGNELFIVPEIQRPYFGRFYYIRDMPKVFVKRLPRFLRRSVEDQKLKNKYMIIDGQ